MNNNFKLEKGMYQEPGRSFSQVLEDIDPSDRYIEIGRASWRERVWTWV